MDNKRWTNQDIEALARELKPQQIYDIKDKIKSRVSTWLFGLDKPIDRRVEALFILVAYSDKIDRTKKLGQPHILFRGLTGIGKTDLEQSIALSIDALSVRLQGDPEAQPRHLIGGSKFVENLRRERKVVFELGPIFTHSVLADESNRYRSTTLNILIQAMEERSVTPKNEYIDEADRVVHTLPLFPISGDYTDLESPRWFQVAFTQNPFGDEEGNYPNTQAILDRVMLSIAIDRPSFEDEKKIRAKNVVGKSISPVTNLAELLTCAHYIFNNVELSQPANDYLTRLLRNTNPPNPDKPDEGVVGSPELVEFVMEHVQVGASPRVNFHLEAVARARAFFSGDAVIKPEHIQQVAEEVIAHRLRLAPGVEFSTSKEKVFRQILELTDAPKWSQ